MKLPKLPKIAFPRRQKKLHATATSSRRAPAADEYYDEEPKTNLSSAFVVVLILHVVAVGGIYAFNSIKAARRGQEPPSSATAASSANSLVAKVAAPNAASLDNDNLSDKALVQKAPLVRTAPVSKTTVHRVQPGDNLTKVAAQHGVTVADLEDANGVKNSTGLRAVKTLTIPETGSKASPKAAAPVTADPQKAAFLAKERPESSPAAPTVSAAAKGTAKTYVVSKGDTATSIARRFNTTAEDLLKLNKIEDPKKLQLGQSLKLPVKKSN